MQIAIGAIWSKTRPALGVQGGPYCFPAMSMKAATIFSLVCWLSVVGALWAVLLGWVAPSWPAVAIVIAWAVMGAVGALMAGRYGARQ